MNRRLNNLVIPLCGVFSMMVAVSCSSDVRQDEQGELPTGTLQPIGRFVGEQALDSLYRQTGVPLVVIEEIVYLPSVPCVEPRTIGGEQEDRDLAGGTEQRKLGGETEDRKVGGETEDRKLAGQTEDRKLAGETEDRKVGGETEDRKLAGQTEDRKLAGETEDRKLAGDSEQRKLGGETENRDLAGETEGRGLGGASIGLQCSPFPSGQGFRILNPPRARVRVYDGISLKDVQDGRVMY
ncbi:MAG TPA: hypothetical protein VNL36_06560 [Bacteroidota bacterium]|nr:hypothetical protein [Bacteroidota bacterium]